MSEPIKLSNTDWVQLAPVGFESAVIEPLSGKFWLEFAAAKPAATILRAGRLVCEGWNPSDYSVGTAVTNAAWGRPVEAASGVEVSVLV